MHKRKIPSNNSKDPAARLLSKQSVSHQSSRGKKSSSGSNFFQYLCDPVDNINIVFIRIVWGLLMTYECYTFIESDYKKLENYYLRSDFYPKYYLFDWVKTVSVNEMYYLIWIMLWASMGMTLGMLYHLSAAVFFFGWLYLFLLDASLYLNHWYMILLFSFVFIFVPANRDISVDAVLFPTIRTNTVPRYVMEYLKIQQVIVYFYAGVAKINVDWLRGEPIRHWVYNIFIGSTVDITNHFPWLPDYPTIYYLFNQWILFVELFFTSELGVYIVCYGGLIFDLLVGFLLYTPTKRVYFKIAVGFSIFFHLLNKAMLNIGIFPYAMLALLCLFFQPEWIRGWFPTLFFEGPSEEELQPRSDPLPVSHKIILILLACLLLHQAVFPLRHHMYYDNVAWNEMGHRFSWRMKLRDKICDIELSARDDYNDKTYRIDFESHLYGKQPRKIISNPELLIQFCHHIADTYTHSAFSGRRPKIFASVNCDLNYRGKQQLFDPNVDLASVDPFDWSNYSKIITSLQSLPHQYEEDLPWNWSWERISLFFTDPFHRHQLYSLNYNKTTKEN